MQLTWREVLRHRLLNCVAALKRKAKHVGKRSRNVDSPQISVEEKIGRAIAMLLIKDMEPEESAVRLSGIGYSALEISSMLLVNNNYVNVAKARWRKRQKAKIRQAK